MQTAFISIGSNLGDKLKWLRLAKTKIEERFGSVKASRIYETESWGYESENTYFNAILSFESHTSGIEILNALHEIEDAMGRKRSQDGYQDRAIDLDLVLYGEIKLNRKEIVVPHERMHLRSFVLLPILDLADPFHPVLKKYCSTLYTELEKTEIRLVDERL